MDYVEQASLFGGGGMITNGDIVREMTDEELVALIFTPCPKWNEPCSPNISCHDCLRDWLKQEVEE